MRFRTPWLLLGSGFAVWLSLAGASGVQAEGKADEAKRLSAAVSQALPLLQKGAAGHAAQRTCFSCHHQALPVLALNVARQRGFKIDDDGFRKQLAFTHNSLAQWAKRTPDRKSFTGGQADTAGYALLTLAESGWKPDATTQAVAEYLLWRNRDLDHWQNVSTRPPSEASPFTTTALALGGLQAYGAPEQQERIAKRLAAARTWLLRTKPKDNEDRVFRLWALKHAGAGSEHVKTASADLLDHQTKEGGWAQTEKLPPDAYATGSALVVLHRAGGLPVSAAAYGRGLDFLVRSQLPDGSWLVRSRSKPFQTYFESGFPHGKDQWISCAATGWAAAAIALATNVAIEPKSAAGRRPAAAPQR